MFAQDLILDRRIKTTEININNIELDVSGFALTSAPLEWEMQDLISEKNVGILPSSRLAEMLFPGSGNSKFGIWVCEIQVKGLNPSRGGT